jgi:UPF0176 protein
MAPHSSQQTEALFKIAAFYQFAALHNLITLQAAILEICNHYALKGIVLIAPEGINGTLSGTPQDIQNGMAAIRAKTRMVDLQYKTSFVSTSPFLRIKVRIKTEIVTIGDTTVDPVSQVGTYVEAEDWNALISNPEILLVDVRNGFEHAVGSFKSAVDPQTTSFVDFPSYVKRALDPAQHKKIAMFCTGGIRCEKATSLMLREGFEEVYHLKGGILTYLERIPADQSLWDGGCFVFDERVAVGHGLEVQPVLMCMSCNTPLNAEELTSPQYELGVCCPKCFDNLSNEHKASARERQRQIAFAKKRGGRHLGPPLTK